MNHVAAKPQPSHEPYHRDIGRTALTWGDQPARAAVQLLRFGSMQLLARDHRVLTYVARFKQLTTPQVNTLVFHENRSITPCKTALQRLVRAGLLEHVEQRHPGGRLGGSSVNVFQLGKQGWPLFNTGRRKFSRVIQPHALVVADVYIAALVASRDGWLDILEWQVESDAWVNVAGADIRPDLYLDLGQREKRQRHRLNIEVDLGGERQKQIVEKLERYIYASQHHSEYPDGQMRQVLFLTDTDERLGELKRIVKRSNAPDGLIMVEKVENFPAMLR